MNVCMHVRDRERMSVRVCFPLLNSIAHLSVFVSDHNFYAIIFLFFYSLFLFLEFSWCLWSIINSLFTSALYEQVLSHETYPSIEIGFRFVCVIIYWRCRFKNMFWWQNSPKKTYHISQHISARRWCGVRTDQEKKFSG